MNERVLVQAPRATQSTSPPLERDVRAKVLVSIARKGRAAQVRHWNETVLVNAMVANAAASGLVSKRISSHIRTGVAAGRTMWDWDCVATAETGADFTMHGATYSTAYGVVNDIVRQYATPDVAARIFAGTATKAEQLDVVSRFAAEHGTGGWGELTKAKCGG